MYFVVRVDILLPDYIFVVDITVCGVLALCKNRRKSVWIAH